MDPETIILEVDQSIACHFKITEGRLLELVSCPEPVNPASDPTSGRSGGKRGRGIPNRSFGSDLTINEVGGLDEQISFIQRSVLYPLLHKNTLQQRFGFVPPKGIMFYGNPGTGKTLLAHVIANELSKNVQTPVTFIQRKGNDCVSKLVGRSSANLRKIFEFAKARKPCVLFFDEIDGLCPNRAENNCEHDNGVVTTFLGMMDTLTPGEVFVIAATNRLHAVDPALRRPGRFDKELMFFPPDEKARISILKIHTKDWRMNKPSENLVAQIAAATSGFSGADLKNLCAEASECAIRRFKLLKKLQDMTVESLKQVGISDKDWFQAIRQMERPKTNVFGGILYVPQKDPKIQPLISGVVKGIKEKIFRQSPFTENLLLNTFLIYDIGGAAFATKFVVPELLSDPEFQKYPIYRMESAEILGPQYFTRVQNIMAQVLTSTKPCILYLPDCDKLFSSLSSHTKGEKDLSFLVQKLNLAMSRPVLILGSASCSQNNFPEESRKIFPGMMKPELSYKLRSPNEMERRMFFATILDKRAFGGGSKQCEEWDEFFLQKLELCVKITEHDPLDYLVDLYIQLQSTGDRYKLMDDEKTSKSQHVKAFKDALTEVIEYYRIKS